ncbi:MAG: AI-2E family transporter [Tissierellia bacterium]|nr:AI-2E family transporter [Tissierellia bacterium]
MGHITLNNAMSVLLIALFSVLIYYIINIGNKYVKPDNMIVLTRNTILRALIIIVTGTVVILFFRSYPIIPTTLVTVFIAIVVAYIINPLVRYVEGKMGLNRLLSIAVVYVIIFGFIAILLGIIIPKTVTELRNLVVALPNIFGSAQQTMDELTEILFKDQTAVGDVVDSFTVEFNKLLRTLQTTFFTWLSSFAERVPNYFSNILRIILIPVVSFYLLLDKEALIQKVKSLIPTQYKDATLSLLRDIDTTMAEFVRGRVIMAIFVGVATGIALMILGVDFAIVLGIVTMVADIVPYIGPFLGFLPAVVLAFIQSPIKAIWVAVIFVLLQWMENNIIGPKILGESIGMNPLIILLSLIVGGGMAGVFGMIFAVPIVATIKVILTHIGPYIRERLAEIWQD